MMYEEKALIGYAFWAFLLATSTEDDDERVPTIAHVLRALPGLGIFKELPDETVGQIIDTAHDSLQDILFDPDKALSTHGVVHLDAVREAGLMKSLFTFLISIIACCGQSGDSQVAIFLDVAEEVDDAEHSLFRERLKIFRELHNGT